MQGSQSVPQDGGRLQPASGPALKAPSVRRPQDTYGGPTGLLFGTVSMLLGDSTPVLNGKQLAHFYIGVREIDAIANGQITVLGSATTPYQMDLLQYQNGSTNWMAQTSVAAQTYTQMRLVVDTASTQAVFTDGTTLPVKFQSSQSSSSAGLGASTSTSNDPAYWGAVDVTVNIPYAVQSSGASVVGDFNLMESLSSNSNTIFVRPTVALASGAGQITGTVLNQNGNAVQNATVVAIGSDGAAVNSSATDQNGAFNLHTLGADTYRLVVFNWYTNAAGQKISASGQSSAAGYVNGPSLSLTAGSTVSAGTIGD